MLAESSKEKMTKMGRLLDEDDVVDWLLKRTEMYDGTGHFVDENVVKKNIESQIAKIPTAQPEMVKCKKCRYVYYDEEFGNYWCDRMSDPFKVEADGYCKWGKCHGQK